MRDTKTGEKVDANVLVLDANLGETKSRKPFVSFSCRAEDGSEFEGCKIWDEDKVPSGVIHIKGVMEEYKGNPQIKVTSWSDMTDGSLSLFIPKAPWALDVNDLAKMLEVSIKILPPKLSEFIDGFIKHSSRNRFPIEQNVPMRFSHHFGAQRIHHGYKHGLLEHTIEVVELCASMKTNRMTNADFQLVAAGALIHDIGKLEEFEMHDDVKTDFTALGKACGWSSNAHLFIGAQMLAAYYVQHPALIDEEVFAILTNIILSHHGEWSPVKPITTAAKIVHLADMWSASTNRMDSNILNSNENDIRDRVGERYIKMPKEIK